MIVEKSAGDSVLPDKTIAQDLLKDCKFCVLTFSQAVVEATDPVVRQFLSRSLMEVIKDQHRIADLMKNKGWYKPYDSTRQLTDDKMTSRLLETQLGDQTLSAR